MWIQTEIARRSLTTPVRTFMKLVFIVLLLAVAHAQPVEYFAAPTGQASANGSLVTPWDLASALKAKTTIKPGDTLWLRGGTYQGAFTSTLLGTAAEPIVIRNYQNERVILDGKLPGPIKNLSTLKIDAAAGHVRVWGLEITNSDPQRVLPTPGSNPPDRRGNAIDVYGPSVKLINLLIYDSGQGIGGWSQGPDLEAYGNVIFNNGWTSTDRGHGHGIYAQNNTGGKLFKHNIVLQQFGNVISTYGSDQSFLKGLTFDANVLAGGRVLIGGGTPLQNLVFDNNLSASEVEIGYSAPHNTGVSIRNNLLLRGVNFKFMGDLAMDGNVATHTPTSPIVSMTMWTGLTLADVKAGYLFDGNTYYRSNSYNDFWMPRSANSFTQWQALGFDLTSTYVATRPKVPAVFIQPNQYDSNRAHVIIVNWPLANTVDVDLSSVLAKGDKYELRNAADYFADVISGTYADAPISITMTGRTVANPLGYGAALSGGSFPGFGAFVLLRTPACTCR